ncbi:MAG: hypothetical protein N838_02420 [Thiohalocapsa sp. PB-PSB1]|jgi:hypothetical protein|nr:MAG: hypothetical protein N838_02420 [Thiohalocapsa sp. PB-PSB1]
MLFLRTLKGLRVALIELLRRAAPSAGQGPLACEAPWSLCVLCALCVSAVNPHITLKTAPFSMPSLSLISCTLSIALVSSLVLPADLHTNRKTLLCADERDGVNAMTVNWCELTTTQEDGKVVYENAFATNHEIALATLPK